MAKFCLPFEYEYLFFVGNCIQNKPPYSQSLIVRGLSLSLSNLSLLPCGVFACNKGKYILTFLAHKGETSILLYEVTTLLKRMRFFRLVD